MSFLIDTNLISLCHKKHIPAKFKAWLRKNEADRKLPVDTREFLTAFGLTQPGTSASQKVFGCSPPAISGQRGDDGGAVGVT